jgi:hypothetical protein
MNMNIKVAYSTKEKVEDIAEEIGKSLEGFDAKTVIFFASSKFDADAISFAMQKTFGDIPAFGCTTSGEIVSGHMLNQSVVAMAMNSRIIEDMDIQILQNIHEDPKGAVAGAFKAFEQKFGEPMADMDFQKYVGIILIDGLQGAEEQLMEKIGDLTNVTFIGGSAGDDLKFLKTHVFAQGKAHSNAALLVLIKAATTFDFIKTQSFAVSDKNLVATSVDPAKREVLEFNHQPAVEAYAQAVGVSVENVADVFMSNPVGLMMGDEPYVRSPQRTEGQGIVFYCNLLEGMELAVLRSEDIVRDTKIALGKKQEELGAISGIINFHCILRTLELKNKNQLDDYGKIFSSVPTVGFSTYGEEYVGHINQTATMLVFK